MPGPALLDTITPYNSWPAAGQNWITQRKTITSDTGSNKKGYGQSSSKCVARGGQMVNTTPSSILDFWSWATHSAIHITFRTSCSLSAMYE